MQPSKDSAICRLRRSAAIAAFTPLETGADLVPSRTSVRAPAALSVARCRLSRRRLLECVAAIFTSLQVVWLGVRRC